MRRIISTRTICVFIYARTLAHTCERQYILLTYNSAVNPTAINIPPTHPMPAHPCVGRHPRCRRRQATHPTESYSFTKTSNFPNYETLSYCSRIGVHVASACVGGERERSPSRIVCTDTSPDEAGGGGCGQETGISYTGEGKRQCCTRVPYYRKREGFL